MSEIKKNQDPLDLLTAAEAGPLFKITPKSMGYLARSNQIPFVQIGSKLRFSRKALEAWIDKEHGEPYRRPGERGDK